MKNPLYYLGVSFSDDGKKVNLHDFIDNKWIKYPDLEGWNVKEVDEELIGKIHRLSEAFEIYDWIDNIGYNNFSNWVK